MAGLFVPICGPVSADTIYCDGKLVGRDCGVDLPEITAATYEIQAMGAMTIPDWSRVEDMETVIRKIGIDVNSAIMSQPGDKRIEIRGVHTVVNADGSEKTVGFKAFIGGYSKKIPGVSLAVGESSEGEHSYATRRYQLFVDGREMWCIDRLAGICRINGVDYANFGSML